MPDRARNNGHDGCALVTGGTRGIGAAIAERLQEDGWNVARLSRTSGDVQADVGDAQQVKAAFKAVRERFGPVLVLVNNAGVRHDGLAIRMPEDEWRRGRRHQPHRRLQLHAPGARRHARRALGAHRQRLVGRRRARQPRAGQLRGRQGGLLGLTRTIAREMARKGVTCNAVTPGVIETDMTADLSDGLVKAVPAGRVGRPEEVAAAVAFLVSDEAAYVNGATLSVDGALGA